MTAETVVPLRTAPRIDRPRAERAVTELLAALGYPVEGEHRAMTPQRVASAFAEMLTPSAFLPTTFGNDEGYDELVVAREVPFRSLCEHHLLPFYGYAHVGYLPGGRIVGLSKLARWWSISPPGCRCRNGSPSRSRTGSRATSVPVASAWCSRRSICA